MGRKRVGNQGNKQHNQEEMQNRVRQKGEISPHRAFFLQGKIDEVGAGLELGPFQQLIQETCGDTMEIGRCRQCPEGHVPTPVRANIGNLTLM